MGLAVVLSGIILVGGMPVVSHAASASLAELTAGASSSYNSVVAKLAASGFLQVCMWCQQEGREDHAREKQCKKNDRPSFRPSLPPSPPRPSP